MTLYTATKRMPAFLPALLAVLLTVLFAASSSRVSAAAAGRGGEDTVRGEIVAVDTVNHIQTLTVRSGTIGGFPNDELNIFLNKNTSVKMCSEKEPAMDLKVGRSATIEYHESGGVPVADAVSERC